MIGDCREMNTGSKQFVVNPKIERDVNGERWTLLMAIAAALLLALVVRIPVIWESLWIDELHTSWVVSGRLAEVRERAAVGNQSPIYYWGMWCWVQVWGGSEGALRCPSLMASLVMTASVVWVVSRVTASARMGGGAGAIVACDTHAIFFGTEARVYAWVMMLVSLMVVSDLVFQGWRRGLAFAILAGSAVALHITSGLVVGLLMVAWTIRDVAAKSGSRWSVVSQAFGVAVGVGLACLLVLLANQSGVSAAWQARSAWRSFAVPSGIADLWSIWLWGWWLLVPCCLGFVSKMVFCGTGLFRNDDFSRLGETRLRVLPRLALGLPSAWFVLWGVVMLATAAAWGLAWLDIAPLWHRRYIVGLVPLVGIAGALSWGWLFQLWQLQAKQILGGFFWLGAVGGFMYQQGTLQQLWRGDTVWVTRGEGWRGAQRMILRESRPNSPIILGTELLESRWLSGEQGGDMTLSPLQREYLTYAGRGLYPLSRMQPLGPTGERRIWESLRELLCNVAREGGDVVSGVERSTEAWLIIRQREQRLGWLADLLRRGEFNGVQWGLQGSWGFGKVTVMRIEVVHL